MLTLHHVPQMGFGLRDVSNLPLKIKIDFRLGILPTNQMAEFRPPIRVTSKSDCPPALIFVPTKGPAHRHPASTQLVTFPSFPFLSRHQASSSFTESLYNPVRHSNSILCEHPRVIIGPLSRFRPGTLTQKRLQQPF